MLKIEKGTRNRIIPKWNFHKYLVCQHVFTLVAFLPAFRADIFFVKITHADALLESRAFFFCPVFGKAAPGAPSGMRTARPAGQRPGRFQQSCGLLESARVPAEPGWRNGSSAPSPSGRDHASRGRSHSPRGEVAKYAPQERFLHAPAGAPKKALRKRKAFSL